MSPNRPHERGWAQRKRDVAETRSEAAALRKEHSTARPAAKPRVQPAAEGT